MTKLFAALIAAAFAVVSFGAVAAKHEDGMKKDEMKKEMKKDGKKEMKKDEMKKEMKKDEMKK